MKIYCARNENKNSLDYYLGKDVWIKLNAEEVCYLSNSSDTVSLNKTFHKAGNLFLLGIDFSEDTYWFRPNSVLYDDEGRKWYVGNCTRYCFGIEDVSKEYLSNRLKHQHCIPEGGYSICNPLEVLETSELYNIYDE